MMGIHVIGVRNLLAGVRTLAALCVLQGCGQVTSEDSPEGPNVDPHTATEADQETDAPAGAAPIDDGSVSSGNDNRDEVTGDEECPLVEPDVPVSLLDLPAVTTTHVNNQVGLIDAERSTPDHFVAERHLTLAFGEDYPSAVTLELGRVFGDCGVLGDDFVIQSIELLEGSARVTAADSATLAVEVDDVGDSLVEVSGLLTTSENTGCAEPSVEVPLTYSIRIRAEVFEWPIDLSGSCPAMSPSGRSLPISIHARDKAGQRRSPANVSQPAIRLATNGSVRLRLPSDAPGYLSDVIATGSGTVTATALESSHSLEVRVLEPAEFEDVHLEYALTGIFARGDLALQNEQTYGFSGDAPRVVVNARWLFSEGVGSCGLPHAQDFHVTSLTPEICPVESRQCRVQQSYFWEQLWESIPVIANGTCTLRIDAPLLAGGAGVSKQLSVTLMNGRQ